MKQDVGLLGLIREIICSVEKHLQHTCALVQEDKALHTFWQGVIMPNDEYLKLFNAQVTALGTLGGPLQIHLQLVTKKLVLMGLTGTDRECLKPDLYEKAAISAQKE